MATHGVHTHVPPRTSSLGGIHISHPFSSSARGVRRLDARRDGGDDGDDSDDSDDGDDGSRARGLEESTTRR